jgi:D-threo-aldose 1-dehydrogenase
MTTPTNLELPKVIFGTSSLGNLYIALPENIKMAIVKECVTQSGNNVVFDSAGKYGAGLALESLGKCLSNLAIQPEKIVISNKLGWFRTELKTPEPTFEKGVWVDLKHDAVQMISYDGIMQCFEQGNELLNGFKPQMVSVHDPDEYLASADSPEMKSKRYEDIIEAYRALSHLKATGEVITVGIGAKDWRIIERISKDVKLDWVMIANSMTLKNHPLDLLEFMTELEARDIPIINSAVFHSGFLIGGDYYDYKTVQPGVPANDSLFKWRNDFFKLCKDFQIKPAEACVAYALKAPGVKSIALNTTDPKRVKQNLDMACKVIPADFWAQLMESGLINNYLHLDNSAIVRTKISGE